jgi:hypothetical protein
MDLKSSVILTFLRMKCSWSRFLGTFEILRKATISFVMSVRLSVRMEQLGSRLKNFHEI